LFLIPDVLADTSVFLSPVNINVVEGEQFELMVGINPAGVNNYTTKIELNYPPDLLEVNSFKMNDSWVSLKQPGYDLINNNEGILIKTGGYPRGVSSGTAFGTATFRAKKTGEGIIEVDGSTFVLDIQNNNVYDKKSVQTYVTIVPVVRAEAPAETAETETEEIPEQLFDINLEIDKVSITNIKDLISRVIFISFGRVPTPVDLTFNIVNKTGEIVHSQKDQIVVETEGVLIERFKDLDLPLGRYTLVVKTLYNVNVEDEFKVSFEIIEKRKIVETWYVYVLLVLIFIVVASLYFWNIKRNNGTKKK